MFKKTIRIIAIIPARGGSKSILRKNIKLLVDKPLIAYTIKVALKSKYINRTIVSTEDKEIAKIAKSYGAEVPFMRPKELAKNTSSSLLVVLHVLKYLEKKEKYFPDIIVFLQPTSPFRKAKHIDEAVEKIENADSVVSVCEVKEHPYIMMRKKGEFLKPLLNIKNRPLRRQDFPKIYRLNGAVCVAKRKYYNGLNENDSVVPEFSGKVKTIIMDEISSLDIDSPLDFSIAEAILKSENQK